MKASEAPTIRDSGWNAYRARVIAAITDVEVMMRQLDRGINCEVLAEEVADRLGLEIDTAKADEAFYLLVRTARPIAQEGLRRTREDQGGQYSLLLF